MRKASSSSSLPPLDKCHASAMDWACIERQVYQKRGHSQQLLDAYRRCKVDQDSNTTHDDDHHHQDDRKHSEIVLITGPSGVGKTGLAMTLSDQVQKDGGYFCRGKFDQPPAAIVAVGTERCHAILESLNNHNSFAPFVTAMTEYCRLVIQRNETANFAQAIQLEFDSSEVQVLEESIPSLRHITTQQSTTNKNEMHQEHWHGLKGPEAEKRYMHLFSKLVRAASSQPDRPLILLIDDLQWADATALQLFKLLASATSTSISNTTTNHDGNKSGFLLIGTSRSDDSSWLITTDMDGDESAKRDDLTHIPVGNLTQSEASDLVSDLLQLSQTETESLSKLAHHQTSGNLFFLKQYLSVLYGSNNRINNNNKALLKADSTTLGNTCIWKEGCVVASDSEPATVLDLLTQKILQLSEFEQNLLKIASCVGGNIHFNILSEMVFPSSAILPALGRLQEEGLIQFDVQTGSGCFLHDRIQEAAYSLIAESDRAKQHLNIGLRLWIWLSPAERDAHIFLIANQIIRGMHLLDDPVEKNELAEFMLCAGEKAAKLSSFSTAAVYYEVGIKLLDRRHWKTNYKLSLSLFNAAGEVHYYNGNDKQVELLLGKVFKHAKTPDDKFRAQFTQIYSLGSRDNMKQALDKGLEVLKSVGETFPKSPGKIQSEKAFHRCLCRLRKKTDEQIQKLPLMRDCRKLVIMRLLNTIWGFTIIRDRLGPFLLKEMIDTTLQHGLSPMCCVAFAAIGYYLGRRGFLEEGERYGRLSWILMERFQANEWQCRILPAVLGGGCYRKCRIRDLIKPLQTAHRAGLVAGDVHFSMVCASLQCRVSFVASLPLSTVARQVEEYRRLCDQYNQQSVSIMLTHQLQLCHNLMGKSFGDDPLVLTGEVMNEAETMKDIGAKHPVSLGWLWLMKHMLAVYFGRFEEAKTIALLVKPSLSFLGAVLPFIPPMHLFLEGLVAARLSQTQKLEAKRARHILTKLRSNQHVTCRNFDNKLSLIEAELAASRGDRDPALAKYQESIDLARRDAFVHEQALACEMAGRALMQRNETVKGCEYLESARSLYGQWGATAKVKQLDSVLQESRKTALFL